MVALTVHKKIFAMFTMKVNKFQKNP